MKKNIIGLVGETGAGKDTFCRYAEKKFKKPVFCFRFSDPLSEVLRNFFDKIKKEDQQWLAIALRKRFGNNILGQAIYKKIKEIKKGTIILDGMRCWEEYRMIRKMKGKIVYITADQKTRWQRVKKRGEKEDDKASFKKFLEKEKVKTEVLIPLMSKKADFKIKNNGSKKSLSEKIAKIAKEL